MYTRKALIGVGKHDCDLGK